MAEEYLDSISNKMSSSSDEISSLSVRLENVDTSVSSSTHRFVKPTTNNDVLKAQASNLPKTTEKFTALSIGVWKEWSKKRKFFNAEFPETLPRVKNNIIITKNPASLCFTKLLNVTDF